MLQRGRSRTRRRKTYRLISRSPPHTCWARELGRMSGGNRQHLSLVKATHVPSAPSEDPPAPTHRPEEGERPAGTGSAGLNHTGTSTGCKAPDLQGSGAGRYQSSAGAELASTCCL